MSEHMSALTEFLLARITEDEAAARHRDVVTFGAERRRLVPDARPDTFDPARVLAECRAKRQIVKRLSAVYAVARTADDVDLSDVISVTEWTLKTLGTLYADHPDYREEWRP